MDALNEGRLENLAHLKKFQFVRADLRDEKVTVKLVKGNDVIFRLAARANIRKGLTDHRWDLEHNVVTMVNLLDGMVEPYTVRRRSCRRRRTPGTSEGAGLVIHINKLN